MRTPVYEEAITQRLFDDEDCRPAGHTIASRDYKGSCSVTGEDGCMVVGGINSSRIAIA